MQQIRAPNRDPNKIQIDTHPRHMDMGGGTTQTQTNTSSPPSDLQPALGGLSSLGRPVASPIKTRQASLKGSSSDAAVPFGEGCDGRGMGGGHAGATPVSGHRARGGCPVCNAHLHVNGNVVDGWGLLELSWQPGHARVDGGVPVDGREPIKLVDAPVEHLGDNTIRQRGDRPSKSTDAPLSSYP